MSSLDDPSGRKQTRSLFFLTVGILTACGTEVIDPALGSLRVTILTHGYDLDEDGYTLVLDGAVTRAVSVMDQVTFDGLTAEGHTVDLTDVASNCAETAVDAVAVQVPAEAVGDVSLEVTCSLLNRLAYWGLDGPGEMGEIFVANSDGSGEVNISNHSAIDVSPKWSPDGTRILFETDRDGNREIYVMAPDGSDVQNLTMDTAGDLYASWSPDGSLIVFASDRGDDPDKYGIFTMDADGSNVTQLTAAGADYAPAWSPDGTRIAFTRREPTGEIYIMDADGSNVANLTNDSAFDWGPAWSPDGTRIAFRTDRDGNPEIYTMDPDGGNLTNITNHPAADSNPAWAPAALIVFSSVRGDAPNGLYLMEPDGSNPVALTPDRYFRTGASWSWVP